MRCPVLPSHRRVIVCGLIWGCLLGASLSVRSAEPEIVGDRQLLPLLVTAQKTLQASLTRGSFEFTCRSETRNSGKVRTWSEAEGKLVWQDSLWFLTSRHTSLDYERTLPDSPLLRYVCAGGGVMISRDKSGEVQRYPVQQHTLPRVLQCLPATTWVGTHWPWGAPNNSHWLFDPTRDQQKEGITYTVSRDGDLVTVKRADPFDERVAVVSLSRGGGILQLDKLPREPTTLGHVELRQKFDWQQHASGHWFCQQFTEEWANHTQEGVREVTTLDLRVKSFAPADPLPTSWFSEKRLELPTQHVTRRLMPDGTWEKTGALDREALLPGLLDDAAQLMRKRGFAKDPLPAKDQ